MGSTADFRTRYGNWALVIGASYGLGEALARDAARRGMNVAMVARGAEKLEAAAKRVSDDFGVETKAIAADLADPHILQAILDGLDGTEIGFLIYNCAVENGGEFIVQDLDRHMANIQVNCIAPTILVHHFAREMAERGRGGIVVATSMAADQGLYAWVSYGGSKAYEMILGQGLWYELKKHGVDATAFMIGSTYTPNFQHNQKLRNTPFAETRTPEGLPEGAPLPQPPEEASANLFAQIEREWIPMIWANPEDEKRTRANASLSLAERIRQNSDPVKASFAAAPGAKDGLLII